MYQPDIKGVDESRKFVQFLAGIMNELNDVDDAMFSQAVDVFEQMMTNLVPGLDPVAVAWTVYALGFIEGQEDKIRGLFMSAMGDALLQREETREAFGDEVMPRPEPRKPGEPGKECPGCGEVHEPVDMEARMTELREMVPVIKAQLDQVKRAQAMGQDGMREALMGDPKAVLRALGLPEELIANAEVEIVDSKDLPPGATKADFLRHLADKAAAESGTSDDQLREIVGPVDFESFQREVLGDPEGDAEDGQDGSETPPEN